MKACLIVPTPDLETFVDWRCDHHLTLSHLLTDPAYVSFYRKRAEAGDFIILDNGAKENLIGEGMEALLNGAIQIGAKEVVLTDVRYESLPTIDSGAEQLRWLRARGRDLYRQAGRPRLMLVPQGRTFAEWRVCLRSLLEHFETARHYMPEIPEPTVAFAYHYDHMFECGLLGLLHVTNLHAFPIHLLGWPRRLETLAEIRDVFPHIRSVDSGRPFSYARAGVPMHPRMRHVERQDDFFTSPVGKDEIAWFNIAVFRRFAGDE